MNNKQSTTKQDSPDTTHGGKIMFMFNSWTRADGLVTATLHQ